LRVKAWRRAHPESKGKQPSNEAKRRYELSERGKERSRINSLKHYYKDVERSRERNKQAYSRHYARRRDVFIQNATNRKAHVKRATPQWADRKAIAAVYKRARQMTADSGVLYTVDHIIPLRSPVVCGLHIAENLQILTGTENCRKRNKAPSALMFAGC
jgi:hypothetical protein